MDKQCEDFLNYAGVINKDLLVSIPSSYDEFVFDDFDEAAKLRKEHPEWHLWTMIDGDEGGMYIVSGFHYVNRSGYVFTMKSPSDATFSESREPDGSVTITYFGGDELQEANEELAASEN